MSFASSLFVHLRHPWAGFFRARTGRARGTQWIELPARRIFILPTRAGLGFALLLAVMLLGAINYNNNLIFGLTFLLAGLGVVTMLHTYRNLAHLRLQAGQGRPGFVGERVGFEIWLQPADARPRFAIELAVGDERVASHVEAQGSRVRLHRPADRRGAIPLGLVRISTCFPLGLFTAWSRVEFQHSELAYPAPAPPGPRPPRASDAQGQAGDRGEGREDFRGFRDYHPGDSLRHVYWKALAREQGLLTKEFGSTDTQRCWLDYANTPETAPEARLQRLCRWVLEAERGQLSYGLRLPGQELPPARGNAHRDRCLAALARFEVGA